ncbi:BQ5605_C003g02482 [Microbotryum silenes-dioicae]|uniref:BQ5605_C003g02482 protein n=1 Tax=Microbotryum silenes-dioicae TaxID=796604 RepID=A0A2X0M637_9BASI|nr:BQ5605_C003g02482 [Microbotryum silenes-dioicae]
MNPRKPCKVTTDQPATAERRHTVNPRTLFYPNHEKTEKRRPVGAAVQRGLLRAREKKEKKANTMNPPPHPHFLSIIPIFESQALHNAPSLAPRRTITNSPRTHAKMATPLPQTEDTTIVDAPFAVSDQKPTLHTL